MRYCFVKDDDCHLYMIPVTMREEFNTLSEKAADDYDAQDEFEKKFGDMRPGTGLSYITFENPKFGE